MQIQRIYVPRILKILQKRRGQESTNYLYTFIVFERKKYYVQNGETRTKTTEWLHN